jgi:hypothetical protein
MHKYVGSINRTRNYFRALVPIKIINCHGHFFKNWNGNELSNVSVSVFPEEARVDVEVW